MTPLENSLQRAVKDCIDQANQQLTTNYAVPHIRFDIRGKTAGMALLQKWELRFNPILMQENPEAFLKEVVPHEVSHLLVYARYGRVKPHGKEWQHLMRSLYGVKPERCHQFDLSSLPSKQFIYQCACQTVPFSILRHNKVVRKQASYFCRQCKQPFLFVAPK